MSVVPEPELEQFWTKSVFPILDKLVWGRGHCDLEVNSRLQALLRRISIPSGGKFIVRMVTTRFDETDLVDFAATIDNGSPVMCVFLPTLLRVRRQSEDRWGSDWRRHFEGHVEIGIFHELCHLGGGWITENNLQDEIEAWAQTCEEFIDVYVRRGYPWTAAEDKVWDVWLACGRDKTSPLWSKYVATLAR